MIKKISCLAVSGTALCVVVVFLFLVVALSLTTCSAGRWEDDPGNFKRAFQGNIQPDKLVIVHSRYMRTPHFTYEYEYFFEVRPNKQLLDEFIGSGQMKRYENVSDLPISLDEHFEDKPVWFTPKPLDNYDVWIFKEEPRQNFRLFIDKQTGELYYTDFST